MQRGMLWIRERGIYDTHNVSDPELSTTKECLVREE